MDAKKTVFLAVVACLLLTVCIEQSSAQRLGGLRWGRRELSQPNEIAWVPKDWPFEKSTVQKRRGKSLLKSLKHAYCTFALYLDCRTAVSMHYNRGIRESNWKTKMRFKILYTV